MLIKAADGQRTDVAALEALLAQVDLADPKRKRIEQEIWAVRGGAKGEADAAYEIEFRFGNVDQVMTLHDLRIEVEGRVAQIDHLILNRFFQIWVCESKSFSEGVAINDSREWSSYRRGRPYGIASPIEQNKRHIEVLNDLFARGLVNLPKRLGITVRPRLESLVLLSNHAHVSRPTGLAATKVDGLDRVVKCEQLVSTIDKAIDKMDTVDMARTLVSIVSRQTVQRVARELASLHKPATVDWAARWDHAADLVQSGQKVRMVRRVLGQTGKVVHFEMRYTTVDWELVSQSRLLFLSTAELGLIDTALLAAGY